MTLLDRVVRWLLPREDHFYELLAVGARCCVAAGEAMGALCAADTAARDAALQRIVDVEHEADSAVRAVYDALSRTFVTPIDRSDIYDLASRLEEVVDLLHATAMHVRVHAMSDMPDGALALCEKLTASCREIAAGVEGLRHTRQLDAVHARARAASRLEHEADEIFRSHVARLFREERDAIRLIQHREFLEGLERAIDACDHVGGVLTAIVIKNG